MKLRTILNRAFEATIGPCIRRGLERDAEKNQDLFALGQHSQSLFDALGTAWKDAEDYLRLLQNEQNLSQGTLGRIGTFLEIYSHVETAYDSICGMIKEHPKHLDASQKRVDDDWKRYKAFHALLKVAYKKRTGERIEVKDEQH